MLRRPVEFTSAGARFGISATITTCPKRVSRFLRRIQIDHLFVTASGLVRETLVRAQAPQRAPDGDDLCRCCLANHAGGRSDLRAAAFSRLGNDVACRAGHFRFPCSRGARLVFRFHPARYQEGYGHPAASRGGRCCRSGEDGKRWAVSSGVVVRRHES